MSSIESNHLLQQKVDAMLRRGIMFSIFWLMGIGSAIAIIEAIKARRIIKASNGEIRGSDKISWCFIVGGAGLLFWLFVIVKVIINKVSS